MATRWGIVSAGKISNDFVCAVRSLPKDEHQIVSVAARNLSDAKSFAQTHEIPKAYSFEEMAKDPEIDVVYVGTINSHHYKFGEMMLSAGKHVLMEKPMTLNEKMTRKLIDLSKSKNVFLMEAIWSRFLPSYQHMMEEIKKGVIGDVCHVEANFGIPIENVDRVSKKALGGSTILDIGIYALNLALFAYQGKKPEEIKAVGTLNQEEVDESIAVALKFGPRKLATITTSSYCDLPCEGTVTGTKGRMKILAPMWCPTNITTPKGNLEFPFPDTVGKCNFVNSSGLRYEAMEVRRCINKRLLESPIMSHQDSLFLAQIMDEIRRQLGVTFPED